MSFLGNLGDRLPVGAARYSLLALVALVTIVVGYLFFISFSILPTLRDRNELASRLELAEAQLLATQRAEDTEPQQLRDQVATAQAKLNQTASAFLDESQAAEVLNALYAYASEIGVEITDLQSQVGTQPEEKGLYDARTFQLEIQGTFTRLTNFVSGIRELTSQSVVISDVNIAEGAERHVLTMTITLYTSPYASGLASPPPPDATSGAPIQDQAQLEAALDAAWASGDWNRAINLLNQGLAADPNRDDKLEKLYVARVNYGYQLLETGNASEASAQFSAALQIKPDGAEALAGQQLALATPTPTLTAAGQLAKNLDQLWREENWPSVIDIIEQVLALDPNFVSPDGQPMTEKLYAAHVNHGYQLTAQNRLEEAKQAFIRALDVQPEGEEAVAGLRALAGDTPPAPPTTQPEYITYVVQRGDTLFSISRRYGTTVQAIMVANGLANFNIRVGQELRIPVRQ